MAGDTTGPSPNLAFIFRAIDGFIPSIVAIGCTRAWLSMQTGLVAMYETSLAPDILDGWVQAIALVVASILLSFVKLGPFFAAHRKAVCLALGVLGAAAYATGLYATPQSSAASVAVAVVLIVLFCWTLRVWCEDNCSSDLRAVLARLCLSFTVQYLLYSILFLVPPTVQHIAAIGAPLLIMGCLALKPRDPTGCPVETEEESALPSGGQRRLTPFNIATLAVVIAACCASHGLLFGFSETVSGVWLLGSLIIAGISLVAVIALREDSLLKGFVCIALLTQCLSVVLTLLFPENNDWISLSKSMSYAVSMVLTFSIACYLGASRPASRAGSHAAKWVSLYFAAFYAARYLEQTMGSDTFAPLVVVLLCLVLAAILTLFNDWAAPVPHSATENRPTISEDVTAKATPSELRRAACRKAGLTQRELDVLELLLRGAPIKDIAGRSRVSVNTVRSQVQSIYRKLDVHSREELAELLAGGPVDAPTPASALSASRSSCGTSNTTRVVAGPKTDKPR